MDEQALLKISYGLFLLAVREGDKDNACIINTLSQAANLPNRVSISVGKKSLTHELLLRTRRFSASILTEDAPFTLFQRFGLQSGRNTDKFDGFPQAARDSAGLLHLTGYANAFVTAQVLHTIDLSSHTLFIAEPVLAETLSQAPSLTYDYYYRHIKPQPEKPKKTGWRCRVCNYVYEGDELPEDFICPWCGHGVADFERVEV